MIYAENVFICIAAPFFVAIFFAREGARRFCEFFVAGVTMCLLAAYINSFLVTLTGYSMEYAVICVTPISEELMKVLPIMFYFLVMEPDDDKLITSAVATGVGFATFENCCYLLDAGAADFGSIMIRGLAVGVMHTMCTLAVALILVLFGRYHRMMPSVLAGMLAAAVTFHALYNMLVSVEGVTQMCGYAMPLAAMVISVVVVNRRKEIWKKNNT